MLVFRVDFRGCKASECGDEDVKKRGSGHDSVALPSVKWLVVKAFAWPLPVCSIHWPIF